MEKELFAVRHADAQWEGNLREGCGRVAFGSKRFEGPYTFDSRFASGEGTTPEEMVAAAHASCFAMATSAELAKAGHTAGTLNCTARVTLAKGPDGAGIDQIALELTGNGAGFTLAELRAAAETAKAKCPVSKALAAVPTVTLTVTWLD